MAAVAVLPVVLGAAIGPAVVAEHIVAEAATVAAHLALMLAAAHTEMRTAADIPPVVIAAAPRTAAATAPVHPWRRAPRMATQVAGTRLVMARILQPRTTQAPPTASASRGRSLVRPTRPALRHLRIVRSRPHTIWLAPLAARTCWPPITVMRASELPSARTVVATVTDAATASALASATRTDMGGVEVGALAGDLDWASDGDGAGVGSATIRTSGPRTTAAIRSGDGAALAATILQATRRRVRTRLMVTPAIMAATADRIRRRI